MRNLTIVEVRTLALLGSFVLEVVVLLLWFGGEGQEVWERLDFQASDMIAWRKRYVLAVWRHSD